ncbi:MAG: mechanosensitive ion channel family protein [candidate division Zixibacteria bacterium]|nr:mechanosensitive ion channel family protein [candidate division Zixibacteria bacterium]NIT54178.1 mechanosensitive ion channel family protein [candidate division Zixibacteria bacterium]NIW42683.1 mechanosensitive ion channel [candidate division Zixibacteria bacterium]NIX57044.1 mechanosensitive ion channel [candidate division Zixibacteria bacterium]
MDLQELWEIVRIWLINHGLKIILILILMIIALKVVKVFSRKIFDQFRDEDAGVEMRKRADTLSGIIQFVLAIVVVIIAVIMILGEFGIQIGPILAAAGIVGVAVGFGAQYLVQDVISGFFILLQDQIRVGDVVILGGKGGLVEKVSLKNTVLRDLSGNVHFIRNGTIDIVTNMTKDFSQYVFEIGVAYRENVDEVIEVAKAVDEELRNDDNYKDDILEPLEVLGLDQFADSALIIKARTKTKPIKQWRVAREFNRRLKMAFDEKGIEIPFPHVTLYMGEDKQGGAPPMHVKLMGREESPA